MKKYDVIWKRKSCRLFEDKGVKEEDIKEIVRAGQQAPSPKNIQPWRFMVIKDQEEKKKISETLKRAIKNLQTDYTRKGEKRQDLSLALGSAEIIEKAPIIIFVYMNTDGMKYHDDGVKWHLYAKDVECNYIMSVGAAIENMLLAATEMGLDSLWMGDIFYAHHELQSLFNEEGILMAAIALGYGIDKSEKKSRMTLEQVLSWT